MEANVKVNPASRKKIITVGACLAVVALIIFSCMTVVDTSEVGIKFKKFSLTDQGKLDAVPVTGWVFYNPITTSVYSYPVYVQRVDYSPFTVTTKDAAVFSMDPVLAFRLNRAKAVDVFAKYRKPLTDIEEGYMRTVIYDAYRITANKYTSDELMASRAQFEGEVRLMLERSLNDEGFLVEEFFFKLPLPQGIFGERMTGCGASPRIQIH